MGKRYVMGDIHGSHKGFVQLLNRVNFNKEEDILIFLGDVTDGWSEVKECIEELMTIKNLIFLRGNHDEWVIQYYNEVIEPNHHYSWLMHGGDKTLKSLGDIGIVDRKYIDFLESSIYYYELEDKLFVHAGVPRPCCGLYDDAITPLSLDLVPNNEFIWDRIMVKRAYNFRGDDAWSWGDVYNEIYVGHTPTISFNSFYRSPQHWGNIWLMDTGGAFTGSISIKDIDTGEIWQSTPCQQLHPDEYGRNEKTWNAIKRFG